MSQARSGLHQHPLIQTAIFTRKFFRGDHSQSMFTSVGNLSGWWRTGTVAVVRQRFSQTVTNHNQHGRGDHFLDQISSCYFWAHYIGWGFHPNLNLHGLAKPTHVYTLVPLEPATGTRHCATFLDLVSYNNINYHGSVIMITELTTISEQLYFGDDTQRRN